MPPITTVASGRCTSAPVPVAKAIGRKPSDATNAVISTGRSRVRAPSRMATSSGLPCSRSWLMNVTSTKPFSTATPDNAMKPTAAEMENGSPRNHRAATPPVSASGTAVKTSSAGRTAPKAACSNKKISAKQTGTTMASRWRAAVRFSNCPPQSSHAPAGSFTSELTRSRTSLTNPAKSRPRTLHCATTRRLLFSRLT